ncbi:sensor histidine kinase [Microlunatus flavus]|uniref:histidine kinase n=1 Tax=Microlunatus flavus TaxID=1036181 RepID=A0A1H9L1B0_9ACTN|nr:HAMP domain-containing sensor histidine kinase [Microlunatus flavus]SER05234.1 two-component system, OmpR family, sensor kinase [Microlunatus flavus]
MAGTQAMAPLEPFGRGTLGRRLVIRVTALVALTAILISTFTALATRELLLQQLDRQVDSVAGRLRAGPPNGRPGDSAGLVQLGNPQDSIFAGFADDGRSTSGIARNGGSGRPASLPDSVVVQLGQLQVTDHKQSVELAGLGRYRVVTYETELYVVNTNETVSGRAVVGVPLRDVDRLMANVVGLEALLSLLAIVGAVAVSRTVVRRSLRPLNRVAATAQQVSQLPLDRGEVALAVRVPPEDADPRSEVGRVGQAFNHMLNNVEDALAARQASETKVRQFVADASHELRNPLAAIRGYAELTRRERDTMSENAAFALNRVEAEAERMSYLVEDLLLLARLDSGPDVDVRPVDLSEVVINAVSDARAAGPEHVWQLDLPSEPVVALGDRFRLHQVVANLLANARTHTPTGTQVRASVAVHGTDAVIVVADTGPGIPEDIRSRVFERFTRAEVSRVRTPGAATGRSTGLGLAIVAAVVEAHHGSVGVRSEPGRTEFTVTLPLAPADNAFAGRPTAGVA